MLTTPKTEWVAVEAETSAPGALFGSYVLPLAIVSCLGTLLTGLLWAGTWGLQYFLIKAVIAVVSAIVSFYFASYVIDMLAASFGSEKNINRSAQLVAYSNTPAWIAGLLSFIPVIGFLIVIGGWVYSIYLMYLGIGPMKKTPEDKKVVYMVVAFLIMIVISMLVSAILARILLTSMGYGTLGGRWWGY